MRQREIRQELLVALFLSSYPSLSSATRQRSSVSFAGRRDRATLGKKEKKKRKEREKEERRERERQRGREREREKYRLAVVER